MRQENITLRHLYEARRTIAPWVTATPLVSAAELSQRLDANVYLKLETMQDTGSFKVRGATNHLLHLSDDERARGVVTVSTGNHGRAVAFAARRFGIRALVCMSGLVPKHKVEAIRELGAEIRIVGNSQDEAELEAERLATEEDMVPVPPFDHPHVIAGQGVIGLELLENLPEIDCLLAGLSGGGLISGIAIALKATSPSVRIIGVTMERGPAMYDSVQAGKPVRVEEEKTLADSLAGGIGLINRYTFSLVRDYVDEIVLVSEEQIAAAMAYLYRTEQVIAEGGAAVGVAALMHGLIENPKGNIVCVISGKNVDMDLFTGIANDDYVVE